jgi:tRNA dimethylallyltransferase
MSEAGRRPARVLALMGPTASGKSALAHSLAERLGGELVVADPFQRYRGLEVAADTPRPAERGEVPHHCILDLDLTERSTAAGFAVRAHAAIDDILRRGRVPVVSGGTGLYMRAALSDLRFAPEPDERVRAEAESLALAAPDSALAALAALDPRRAEQIDRHNPRRLARALAAARAAGGPVAPGDDLWSRATRHPTLLVALSRPRDELDRRIAARVRRELGDGLIAEIEAALDTPGLAREPRQIIGMREVAALRAGELLPAQLPARLEARTRRLARKQLTWLRKTPGLVSIDLGAREAAEVADEVITLWEGS